VRWLQQAINQVAETETVKVDEACGPLTIAAANNEPCALCHKPINYQLDGRTKWGPTIDHITGVRYTGTADVTDPLTELQPAHRHCQNKQGGRAAAQMRRRRNRPTEPTPPAAPRTTYEMDVTPSGTRHVAIPTLSMTRLPEITPSPILICVASLCVGTAVGTGLPVGCESMRVCAPSTLEGGVFVDRRGVGTTVLRETRATPPGIGWLRPPFHNDPRMIRVGTSAMRVFRDTAPAVTPGTFLYASICASAEADTTPGWRSTAHTTNNA
jgi:hypothetical protein